MFENLLNIIKNINDDKIFIYNNNEEKGEKFESLISDYINKGFVLIINYRGNLKSKWKYLIIVIMKIKINL